MYLPLNAQMLAVPREVIKMASDGDDVSAAGAIMATNDFDVLPVASDHAGSLIATYWYRQQRDVPPKCFPVLAEDMLPGQTPIEVALDFILRSEKPFVFIRDRLRVSGLLGLSDFNGNAFRIYVFSQVVMLETLLSRFVEHMLGNEVVERQIGEYGREQLKNDQSQGLNYSPCHYLYFKDLLKLCAEHQLYSQLGYPSRKQFEKLGSVNVLRNCAAHPAKTLIRGRPQAEKILERLRKVDDLSFRIRGASLPENHFLRANQGLSLSFQ